MRGSPSGRQPNDWVDRNQWLTHPAGALTLLQHEPQQAHFDLKITYKFTIISITSFCPVKDVKCTLKTKISGHLHWSEWSKQDSLLCNFPVIHVVCQSTGIWFFAFHNKHCMKDRSRRHLDYSGITFSEGPFLKFDMKFHHKHAAREGRSFDKHHHIWNFNLSKLFLLDYWDI